MLHNVSLRYLTESPFDLWCLVIIGHAHVRSRPTIRKYHGTRVNQRQSLIRRTAPDLSHRRHQSVTGAGGPIDKAAWSHVVRRVTPVDRVVPRPQSPLPSPTATRPTRHMGSPATRPTRHMGSPATRPRHMGPPRSDRVMSSPPPRGHIAHVVTVT